MSWLWLARFLIWNVWEKRGVRLRPQAEHEALLARRKEQETVTFRKRYALRAGSEGTLSQGVRGFELRQGRYLGLQKTHLQHVLAATALNLVRIDAFLTEKPHGKTRRSHFAALAAHPRLTCSVA